MDFKDLISYKLVLMVIDIVLMSLSKLWNMKKVNVSGYGFRIYVLRTWQTVLSIRYTLTKYLQEKKQNSTTKLKACLIPLTSSFTLCLLVKYCPIVALSKSHFTVFNLYLGRGRNQWKYTESKLD